MIIETKHIKNIKSTDTATGRIYHSADNQLEWLCVGDYGREANIKADFLGLRRRIDGVPHKAVDLSEKMVVTVSSQKGCAMACNFCDVPAVGYKGNASADEMLEMITHAVRSSGVSHTRRLNIHFARMGEPTFNPEVLAAAYSLASWPSGGNSAMEGRDMTFDTMHPVVSTMLPAGNRNLLYFLRQWCEVKNRLFAGNAGLQFSVNSTDDRQRGSMFSGLSVGLSEIPALFEKLPDPAGRKYTLNFAVTNDTILDAQWLDRHVDKTKFLVKITPIHETSSAVKSGYNIGGSYVDYSVYEKFEEPLLALGWDVIVFVPSIEEDKSRITCGNCLLAGR